MKVHTAQRWLLYVVIRRRCRHAVGAEEISHFLPHPQVLHCPPHSFSSQIECQTFCAPGRKLYSSPPTRRSADCLCRPAAVAVASVHAAGGSLDQRAIM